VIFEKISYFYTFILCLKILAKFDMGKILWYNENTGELKIVEADDTSLVATRR